MPVIAVFGRKDLETGILHNRTNGGDGGPSGRITTQETRNKFIGNNYAKGNKIDREIVDRLTDHKRKINGGIMERNKNFAVNVLAGGFLEDFH